jgi:transposase-like protein
MQELQFVRGDERMKARDRQSNAELEIQAANRLYRLKWPDGFECPNCGYGRCYVIQSRRHPLFECADCRHQTSLTVGTIMEGSRTPLSKWFTAIDLVARLTKGTTAVELAQTIQVTYKTAWLILHKIRHALGRYEDTHPLTGTVRMNNGMYGRPHNSTVYRHPEEHPLLAAVELTDQEEVAKLKIKAVEADGCDRNTPRKHAREAFAQQHIDKHASIQGRHSSYAVNKHPLIRHVCAQASRWLNAAFHGLGGKHLNAYLDEYCCRHNLAADSLECLPDRIAAVCVRFSRITYATLVSKPFKRIYPPSYYIARNQNRHVFSSYPRFEGESYMLALTI